MKELVVLDRVDDFIVSKVSENETNEALLLEKLQTLSDKRALHTSVVDQITMDNQSSEVIKFLFDKVSVKGFGFLEQLATQALQMVFVDEDYKFVIKTGSRGSEKTVEFFVQETKDGITKTHRLSDCGGGIQVLVAFVFRVYYILKTGMRRFVAMDEALIQLSPQYYDSLLQFIQLLIEKFGFKFLWISHSPMLEGKVDKFYEISKGKLYEKH